MSLTAIREAPLSNIDVTKWRVKLSRQPQHPEGNVFAWEAEIYEGTHYRTVEFGATRETALEKARATVKRLKQVAPADEWVTI